jgi:hypothetical protein
MKKPCLEDGVAVHRTCMFNRRPTYNQARDLEHLMDPEWTLEVGFHPSGKEYIRWRFPSPVPSLFGIRDFVDVSYPNMFRHEMRLLVRKGWVKEVGKDAWEITEEGRKAKARHDNA